MPVLTTQITYGAGLRTVFQKEAKDKDSRAIAVGDSVATRFRGGMRHREVSGALLLCARI